MWNFKRKNKELNSISSIVLQTEKEKESCEAWMKEIGVSKLYTKFNAFEDPAIIKDADVIPVQLKIDRIKECQRQYEYNKEK